MKDRPILFKGPMIPPILEDRKTQTRRIATKDPSTAKIYWANEIVAYPPWKTKKIKPYTGWVKNCGAPFDIPIKCPYGVPGDRLWVRETWGIRKKGDTKLQSLPTFEYEYWETFEGPPIIEPGYEIVYRADSDLGGIKGWRPSIHIPRWASRITLEIINVRVERVQDISNSDMRAEGWDGNIHTESRDCWFIQLWDSINAKRGLGWEQNPWVWVIEFKRIP